VPPIDTSLAAIKESSNLEEEDSLPKAPPTISTLDHHNNAQVAKANTRNRDILVGILPFLLLCLTELLQ
jgi:hypothetical protein